MRLLLVTHLDMKLPLSVDGPRRPRKGSAFGQEYRLRSGAIYDDISNHQSLYHTIGKKAQPLLPDKVGANMWDEKHTKTIHIYIVNSKVYKHTVGQFIPRPPLDELKYPYNL
jgi:hypothetical protein